MRHLFRLWDSLERKLDKKYLFLFLDYDGTLSSICDVPGKAAIFPGTKKLLRALAGSPGCRVAIISGRALKDIRSRVGIRSIVYAGNHGLEIKGPKINLESPVSVNYRSIIRQISNGLRRGLSGIRGAFVEDKGVTLSLHYRRVRKKDMARMKNIFHEVTILYLARKKIRVRPGKKVLEVMPALDWNKGKVAMWLTLQWQSVLKNKDILPVYIGDDSTDEDVFRALRKSGITVFVGKPVRTCAQYYLKDPGEVKEFLERTLHFLRRQ